MTGGTSIPHATMSSQVAGDTSSSAAPLSRLTNFVGPFQLDVCLARGHAARHHMRMRSSARRANLCLWEGRRRAGCWHSAVAESEKRETKDTQGR
jgi:hypothetical protein